jgi:hypothetical protein
MSGLPAQFRTYVVAFAMLLACAIPATALGDTGTSNGGVDPNDPQFQPHGTAMLLPSGQAIAPDDAPPEVKAVIDAGNRIATLPYRYGGGHKDFADTAYDCSGSVSFALHGAGLLDATLDSTGLSRWGDAGPGTWITVYANKTHTYLIVAGLRFDTSGQKTAGTRWQAAVRSARGFRVRHPAGL